MQNKANYTNKYFKSILHNRENETHKMKNIQKRGTTTFLYIFL